jgi:hypothetical protein
VNPFTRALDLAWWLLDKALSMQPVPIVTH